MQVQSGVKVNLVDHLLVVFFRDTDQYICEIQFPEFHFKSKAYVDE